VDHVVPRAQFGRNSYRNLVSCCVECNSAKGERDARDFLRSLYRKGGLTKAELFVANDEERPLARVLGRVIPFALGSGRILWRVVSSARQDFHFLIGCFHLDFAELSVACGVRRVVADGVLLA
jgi:hypothetical protein